MPAWLVPAITAAASLAGDLFNRGAAKNANQQQRDWALEDWNRQNEYNSPAAQMQRYKEAGLSPNLIYGQTNTAQPVRSTDYTTPPQPQPAKALEQYLNTRQQQLQTDNLAKQLEVQQANIDFIKANTIKSQSETNWRNLNIDRLRENIMPYDFDYYSQRSKNMAQQRTNMVGQNERAWELQPLIKSKLKSETGLTGERLALTQQTIQNLITSNKLLGEKYLTEKQQNEFVQKVDSVSKVGGLGLKILQMILGK